MLRWAIRAVAANSYKNKAISESKNTVVYKTVGLNKKIKDAILKFEAEYEI